VAIGVILSLAAGKLIASLLYGVSPRDPVALVLVVAVLLVTGALAALMPAWRAARVDPVGALRAD
jgi:ABC-type antimicrobial peptide transport system permease subunit